jgi:hypothetical protein
MQQCIHLERFRAKPALGLDPRVVAGSREENASKRESREARTALAEAIVRGYLSRGFPKEARPS